MSNKEMMVPANLVVAVSAQRGVLARIVPPRDMTAEEIAPLYHLIGDLIDQNYDLSRKIAGMERGMERVSHCERSLQASLRGMEGQLAEMRKRIAVVVASEEETVEDADLE